MDELHMNYIKEWVKIDNKISEHKEEIDIKVEKHKEEMKESIERKKELEENIIKYVENNKLNNLSLNITDGTIKFAKKTKTQVLSIRTIKTIIEKYNSDNKKLKQNSLIEIDIDNLCEYILLNLEKTNQLYMKRDIKDNI